MASLRPCGSPPSSSSMPRRPRKSTAVARREEKAALLKELEVMRAWLRLRRLRQRVAEIKQKSESSTKTERLTTQDEAGAAARVEASMFDAHTVAKAATLLRLQGAVRDCQLLVSSARGLLCAHATTQSHEALFSSLRLPVDVMQRRETLRLGHAQAIRDADAFIQARCTGMDLLTPYSAQERFQDPATGELCGVYFEVTQFPGVQSVQDAYNAARFWSMNLEICVSEQLGDVTIREDTEDDENDEPTPLGDAFWSVRRVRSELACGVSVGGGQAVFGQVFEDADYAVMAVQPVDADTRSPPHASGNDITIRATGVVRVARVDDVIVLTRWARIAFRAAHEHSVTRQQLRVALNAGVGRWFEVFQRVVYEQLSATAQGSPRHGTSDSPPCCVPQPLLYDLR